MHEIDLNTWKRREIYQFFGHHAQPFYMVSFKEDITPLHRFVKANQLSFYQGMIWACTEALNRVEPFLVSVRDGKLVQLDRRHPSFSVLKPGEDQFKIVNVRHTDRIEEYCRNAARAVEAQDFFIDLTQESDDLIYYTCLPWIEMTAMTNDHGSFGQEALDDSIPRVSWGRYTEENGRIKLILTLEVNHRFIDGVHIGQFAEQLRDCMKRLDE